MNFLVCGPVRLPEYGGKLRVYPSCALLIHRFWLRYRSKLGGDHISVHLIKLQKGNAIMSKKFKLIILTLAVVGLLAGALAAYGSVSARSNAAVSDTADVFDFQDHGGVFVMNPQTRGTSDLVRTVDGIAMNIDTTDLPVGAYTVWWVIFNNPVGCSDGECGENDVLPPPGTVEAEVAATWATGGIVGPDRMGHFSARLGVGADAAPGQTLWGELTNPMGAEVHLIVRYHGPAVWGDASTFLAQQYTFEGFCTPASSFAMGTDPDAFACYEPQASIHKP